MDHDMHPSRGSQTRLAPVIESVARIARKEFALARAELSENFDRAKVALVLLGVAAIGGLVALVVLAGSAVAGLVAGGVPLWLAALLIGGGILLVAIAMAAKAMRDLSAESLTPSRTMENAQRDIEALKEQIDD